MGAARRTSTDAPAAAATRLIGATRQGYTSLACANVTPVTFPEAASCST
jgi:hypothetical protein